MMNLLLLLLPPVVAAVAKVLLLLIMMVDDYDVAVLGMDFDIVIVYHALFSVVHVILMETP